MNAVEDAAQQAQWLRWRSVADLYHAYFTGLILTVVTRRGTVDAAEFVFRVFRRQQLERFLPGLEKLGLSHLPPAVAAAQYHYLSNWIGGVSVEYMVETDRKAWIRYPPPRWIWRGTAICGVPGEVSRAMLRGWHANNGAALGNPRLGFVCTKQSVDGQDGLEGYYCEYDHPLEPDQRLVFARHLEAPLFAPATAPALPVKSWPKPRLEKAILRVRRMLENSDTTSQKLDRLVQMVEQRPVAQKGKLVVRSANRLFLVDSDEVNYASIEDGVISIVTRELEGQSNYRTVEELQANLDPKVFWRVHRSFLVNVNRIKEVVPWFKSSYQLKMEDRKQTEIPVSRAQTRKLRELLNL